MQISDSQRRIEICNQKNVKEAVLIDRVSVGEPGDYKPCVAVLRNGDLLVSAFRSDPTVTGENQHEDPVLFRSSDGGRSWSGGEILRNLPGREPYLSVLRDGTLLMTGHVHTWELINREGVCHSYVHRSADNGRSWTTTKMFPDRPTPYFLNARNVLELADGALLTAVSGCNRGQDFVWRSDDGGETWRQETTEIEGVPDTYDMPVLAEAVFWQARSGKVYAIARIDSRHMPLRDGHHGGADLAQQQQESWIDHYERMFLFDSIDCGRTWRPTGDFGYYGEMYPSVLRMQDGRLLLTFTLRGAVPPQVPPLGVRAIVGEESTDGFHFDFNSDRIMLDTRTPAGMSSGGGFGPTVQLSDGVLVTSYSYRSAEDTVRMEILRWSLSA